MSGSFKKFKLKYIRNAAIIAAICGVSGGLAVSGVVLLALKLTAVSISPWYYVLMGVGVAAITFAIAFFALKPSDVKTAKRLDNELGLQERVQTMIEYDGKDGEMLDLQREDAKKRLAEAPAIKPSALKILELAIMPVLACAIFLTSIFVPARQPEPVIDTSDDYELDDWQLTALTQLIGEVESSSLVAPVKDKHLAILGELLESLKNTSSQTAMKASVLSAISMIGTASGSANTYNLFAEKLASSEDEIISGYSASLSEGVKAYASGSSITTFAQVQQRETEIYDTVYNIISTASDALVAAVNELSNTKVGTGINEYATALFEALSAVEYPEGDALGVAFDNLVGGLFTIVSYSETGGYTPANLKLQVETLCGKFDTEAASAMSVQSYTLMMTAYETDKLCSIFGVKVTNPSDDETDDGTGGSTLPDDDPSNGGYGQGNIIYGSDDIIFFPDDGIYVQYGEVLSEYYLKVDEILRDGELTEEAKQFIREYFNILNRGIEEEEADNT